MQRIKKFGHILGLLLSLSASGVSYAHDVQNSEIRVVLGEDDHKGSVEVWQTIPLETADAVARSVSDQREVGPELADDYILEIIGQQLLVHAVNRPCTLTKQAHRRVEYHGERLQTRFLFECPENERPSELIFLWMSEAPSSHFAVVEQNSGEGSPFKVIERGNPVIKFDRF